MPKRRVTSARQSAASRLNLAKAREAARLRRIKGKQESLDTQRGYAVKQLSIHRNDPSVAPGLRKRRDRIDTAQYRLAKAATMAPQGKAQRSPGGFTNRPEHQPSVTGMGNAKHGVSQPHSQAPHVLPPDNVVRQAATHTAATVEAHLAKGGTYSSYGKVPKGQVKKGKIKGKKNVADAIARSNAIIAHGNAVIAGKYKRR